jgi:anti-sigma regulatory factor (Ser/Thr protein kinase)
VSEPFSHELLLYAGEDEFVAGAVAFLREGIEAGEPALVVVGAAKIDRLCAALDGHSERVVFADMAEVGSNPARIIPAWRDFVDRHGAAGRPFRGIGEPIWAERSAAELVECQRHESLLNLAFERAPGWRLLCPYDTESLPTAVIDEALRSHPWVVHRGARRASAAFRGLDASAAPFDEPLLEPVGAVEELRFGAQSLAAVRELVRGRAGEAGLGAAKTNDAVLAVNEVAANSIRHGGGEGRLRVWEDDGALVCEVRDAGRIDAPLVGRERPRNAQESGRGVWMANQLWDQVEVLALEEQLAVLVLDRHAQTDEAAAARLRDELRDLDPRLDGVAEERRLQEARALLEEGDDALGERRREVGGADCRQGGKEQAVRHAAAERVARGVLGVVVDRMRVPGERAEEQEVRIRERP